MGLRDATVPHSAGRFPGIVFAPQPRQLDRRDTGGIDIWNWLQQNADGLKVLGSTLTVLIWFVYLELFYRQYRRQQCPYLVIHHARYEPSALCLLVNMSKEAVHVQCVLAHVASARTTCVHQVTDYGRISASDPHVVSEIRQGPLQPGEYVVLGRFGDILRGQGSPPSAGPQGDQNSAPPLREVTALELGVVVIHGPSDRPVGARRRFVVEHEGDSMRPEHTRTEQLNSRRDEPQVQQWLAECLTPRDRLSGP